MEFSKTKQSFKIGRMTYSLPSYIDKGMSRYWLNFEHNKNGWESYYVVEYPNTPDSLTLFNCTEPTFNKALKTLHAKVKEATK